MSFYLCSIFLCWILQQSPHRLRQLTEVVLGSRYVTIVGVQDPCQVLWRFWVQRLVGQHCQTHASAFGLLMVCISKIYSIFLLNAIITLFMLGSCVFYWWRFRILSLSASNAFISLSLTNSALYLSSSILSLSFSLAGSASMIAGSSKKGLSWSWLLDPWSLSSIKVGTS